MNRNLVLLAGSLACTCVCAAREKKVSPDHNSKPNVIVILTDDQGYADIGCFGARDIRTPNIDRMAVNGMKFNDFYAGSSVSSPSRASIMTGCYPQRVGIPFVLFPNHLRGISPEELTLAEMFHQAGYSTAAVGKWHLGHQPGALPLQQGFDQFFGLPYSNDMKPPTDPDLPLYNNNSIIEYNPDQSQLTTRYTEYATSFIKENKDKPFFLYLAHSMPHVPLAVSDKFKGKSGRGLYGDVIMEIDWSIGEIYKTLKKNGIDKNTWVIYMSDNGPWLLFGNHGGSPGNLREGKTTSFDGGQRVFCLMTWPEIIPAGSQCDEIVVNFDLLPTAAKYLGIPLPNHKIDGEDIFPLISGQPNAKSPHEAFYYYYLEKPEAIRVGDWKFVLEHPYIFVTEPGMDGKRGKQELRTAERALYNLREDIGETRNRIAEFPEKADSLEKMLMDFEKNLRANIRPAKIYKK